MSKAFNGMYAVDNLDLHVPEGAIYGFIGENEAADAQTFTNAWRVLEMVQGGADGMDLMALALLCNTNMVFIFTALLVSIFVSHDYGSGFIKSIFTVHARRVDYVISKTPVGVLAGSCMVLAHFGGFPWRLCSGSRGSPLWNGDRCSRCCATWAARCGSRAGESRSTSL